MTWVLPQPDEIADRLAAGYETAFQPPVTPAGVDARSPNATFAILTRVQAAGAFDVYLYQQLLAVELFADSAQDELARHGDIWGVPRIAASAALGSVILAGVAGTVVPALQQLTSGNAVVETQAAVTLDSGGPATVAVLATTAGAASSLPAGTGLLPVTPLAGLTGATVAAGGLVGSDEEELEAWRGRILERIRSGPDYGQAGAYERTAMPGSTIIYASGVTDYTGLTVGFKPAVTANLRVRHQLGIDAASSLKNTGTAGDSAATGAITYTPRFATLRSRNNFVQTQMTGANNVTLLGVIATSETSGTSSGSPVMIANFNLGVSGLMLRIISTAGAAQIECRRVYDVAGVPTNGAAILLSLANPAAFNFLWATFEAGVGITIGNKTTGQVRALAADTRAPVLGAAFRVGSDYASYSGFSDQPFAQIHDAILTTTQIDLIYAQEKARLAALSTPITI